MNCDHVLAALHIEALLFARRRRIGTAAADAEIDALASFTPPGALLHPKAYVWLDAIPNEALNPDTSSELHGGLLDGRPGNTLFPDAPKGARCVY